MPLGSSYLGQSYLGEGYPSVTVTGSGTLSASFSASGTATTFLPASGDVTGTFTVASTVTTIDPTSGVVSATFSAGFSPEGIGTSGVVSATFSANGQPAVTVIAAGTVTGNFTATATATWFIPTTGVVSATFSAGYVPEAIGIPSAVSASFVALLSPEAIGVPSGLVATFSAGYNPEGLGTSGVVNGLFNAAGAGTVQYFTTASVTGYFSVQTPTLPKVSVPWNQPGNQFVKDILSFGLHANYRVYVQVGVPTAQLGNNGDYCFRPDGTAGARMYVRSGGSWSAIN